MTGQNFILFLKGLKTMGYNDNRVVLYKNSLNNVAFPKLTAKEYDVMYSIFYKVKNKKSSTVEISFEELANLAAWQGELRVNRFANVVWNMNQKLLQINFLIALDDKARVTSQQPLFYEFKTDRDRQVLTVSVNPIFIELFNNLENYTKLELAAVTSFRSKYSKRLYAQLRQYVHGAGWWQVDLAEFRKLLDIPKSYPVGSIIRDIIEPAITEIEPYMGIVVFEPIYEIRNHTRGRKPVTGFKFEFTPEKKHNTTTDKPKAKREEYTCPVCGEKLHLIKGKKGDFWGHDKETKCRKTYQSIAEIKGFKEMPTREDYENEKPHEYTEKELSWIQKMFDKILNQ